MDLIFGIGKGEREELCDGFGLFLCFCFGSLRFNIIARWRAFVNALAEIPAKFLLKCAV